MKFAAKWRWTFEDFKALSQAYMRLTPLRRSYRKIVAIIYALCAVVVVVSIWFGNYSLALLFGFYIVLLLMYNYILGPWVLRRRYRQQNLEGKELFLKADDKGLFAKESGSETTYNWSAFKEVEVTEDYTVLWINLIVGIMVPARAFDTGEEAERFGKFAKQQFATYQAKDAA